MRVRLSLSALIKMAKHISKYTKELLEVAVKDCTSFAQLLRNLDMDCYNGGNYRTIKIKLKYFDIDIYNCKGKGWYKGMN